MAARGRLRAVDAPRRRAVGYIRESTEEQGRGYSPEAQRQAISRYAEQNGLELVEEYVDFETGRSAAKRSDFQRLLTDAEAGRFECVLVFHTSRFARNLIEAKHYKTLLRSELGIDVVSVTQPLGAHHDDPSSYLSESMQEMFDEYQSRTIAFWSRVGLKEKARRGYLTGSLPWGYRKGPDEIAEPDPERAPLLARVYERYATGEESDRTLAAWLNQQGARTAKNRLFTPDTVRELLLNVAYCGYVSARRDQSKTIKGLHEPLISEDLFDRVQQIRKLRARHRNPGRPSNRYVLRGIAYCERCKAKMHGQGTGRHGEPRYYCSTRRATGECDQPLVRAADVETQLADFLKGVHPGKRVIDTILRTLKQGDGDTAGGAREQAGITKRLERLRDLYELGDIDRANYLSRRDALERQLQQLSPPELLDLTAARRVLNDFAILWDDAADDPAARRQLIAFLFDAVWLDDNHVVAVQPKKAFAPFFASGPGGKKSARLKERERRDSNPRPPA